MWKLEQGLFPMGRAAADKPGHAPVTSSLPVESVMPKAWSATATPIFRQASAGLFAGTGNDSLLGPDRLDPVDTDRQLNALRQDVRELGEAVAAGDDLEGIGRLMTRSPWSQKSEAGGPRIFASTLSPTTSDSGTRSSNRAIRHSPSRCRGQLPLTRLLCSLTARRTLSAT